MYQKEALSRRRRSRQKVIDETPRAAVKKQLNRTFTILGIQFEFIDSCSLRGQS